MCSYKLVCVRFGVWGLQTRVEAFCQRVVISIDLQSFDVKILCSEFRFSAHYHLFWIRLCPLDLHNFGNLYMQANNIFSTKVLHNSDLVFVSLITPPCDV